MLVGEAEDRMTLDAAVTRAPLTGTDEAGVQQAVRKEHGVQREDMDALAARGNHFKYMNLKVFYDFSSR